MCHEGDIPAEQNHICYHETSLEELFGGKAL